MEDKKIIYADLSLLLVAFVWGSGFVVTKNALDHVTAYYLLAFRFTIATILLGIIFFKRIKEANLKDIKSGALVGIFLFGGYAYFNMCSIFCIAYIFCRVLCKRC